VEQHPVDVRHGLADALLDARRGVAGLFQIVHA